MARKGKTTEEIIGFLREAEVRIAQGHTHLTGDERGGSDLRYFSRPWQLARVLCPLEEP